MSQLIDVAGIDGFEPDTRRLVAIDGISIALFNLGGEIFAIQDACPHDGGELAKGKLDGEEIICPRHGARFSINTGTVLSPPAYENLTTFQVQVKKGRVLLLIK